MEDVIKEVAADFKKTKFFRVSTIVKDNLVFGVP